jgi:hypothetical protein
MLSIVRQDPVHMNLNWRDRQVNGVTKDHQAHENVDRHRISWNSRSLCLWLQRCSPCTVASPGTRVNVVYHRNFLEHLLRPTSAIRTCCVTWQCSLSHGLFRTWNWEILKHPKYSRHIRPCDYNLFRKVKEILHDTLFRTKGAERAQWLTYQ